MIDDPNGEALALADFLAEVTSVPASSPVVFDDPITSMDYRRIHEVCDRGQGWSVHPPDPVDRGRCDRDVAAAGSARERDTAPFPSANVTCPSCCEAYLSWLIQPVMYLNRYKVTGRSLFHPSANNLQAKA